MEDVARTCVGKCCFLEIRSELKVTAVDSLSLKNKIGMTNKSVKMTTGTVCD